MTGTVYITQDNGKNYSPAHMYGKPTFVTNCKEYVGIDNSQQNRQIRQDISEVAGKYDPEKDWILISGDLVTATILIHEVWNAFGYVRVLKWKSIDNMYVPITLSDQPLT